MHLAAAMDEAFARLRELSADDVEAAILNDGYLRRPLLDRESCLALEALWENEANFRKHVDMGRHAFGEGEYRYFAAPLPAAVAELRRRLYERLAPAANALDARLARPADWPASFEALEERCARAGQQRPTPLLLRYREGGYNRLHQDRYGEVVFPLQVVMLLSRPEVDFDGGEFLLVENTARKQALARSVRMEAGDMVVFPGAETPVRGKRGWVRAQVRHGVSPLTRGHRTTLGIIFHDAA